MATCPQPLRGEEEEILSRTMPFSNGSSLGLILEKTRAG
jgi:hypothetical protein